MPFKTFRNMPVAQPEFFKGEHTYSCVHRGRSNGLKPPYIDPLLEIAYPPPKKKVRLAPSFLVLLNQSSPSHVDVNNVSPPVKFEWISAYALTVLLLLFPSFSYTNLIFYSF